MRGEVGEAYVLGRGGGSGIRGSCGFVLVRVLFELQRRMLNVSVGGQKGRV